MAHYETVYGPETDFATRNARNHEEIKKLTDALEKAKADMDDVQSKLGPKEAGKRKEAAPAEEPKAVRKSARRG